MMREAAQPDLLVSALGYDRGRSCAVVSLAGRADIGDCAWIRPLEAAGASKAVVMCASGRQARQRPGVPAASA
jgi:hypothetical protein